MRAVAAILAVVMAARVAADGPPRPPTDHPALSLQPGQTLTTDTAAKVVVPPEGGVYLDPQAFTYQVNLRRWYETENKVCKEMVEKQPPGTWVAWVVAGGLGLLVGSAAVLAVKK